MRKLILLSLMAASLGGFNARANDLAFTDFPNASPDSLAGGKVLQQRGGLIDFEHGLTAQSLYVIDAPAETVRQKLISWNPATHSELKVWMHLPLPAHPTANDFGGLGSLPDNSSVNYLVNATEKLDPANPSLQVDRDEAQAIATMRQSGASGRGLFTSAWTQIMLGRVSKFLGGNLSGQRYLMSGGDIFPAAEMIELLRSDSRIYARFHPLLAGTPLYGKTGRTPAGLYYESFDIEGGAALGTGAVYQSQPNGAPIAPGSTVVSADLEYFVNNGIYVSVELEQLTPVTINGRPETLVWRSDEVSTSDIAGLHGTERLASGMIMLQDVAQAVDAFRSEFK